jgi:hypothetical protein
VTSFKDDAQPVDAPDPLQRASPAYAGRIEAVAGATNFHERITDGVQACQRQRSC